MNLEKCNETIINLDRLLVQGQKGREELLLFLLECLIKSSYHLQDKEVIKRVNFLINSHNRLDIIVRNKESLALSNYTKLNHTVIANLSKEIEKIKGIYNNLDDYFSDFAEYESTMDFASTTLKKDNEFYTKALEEEITEDFRTLTKSKKKTRKRRQNSV